MSDIRDKYLLIIRLIGNGVNLLSARLPITCWIVRHIPAQTLKRIRGMSSETEPLPAGGGDLLPMKKIITETGSTTAETPLHEASDHGSRHPSRPWNSGYRTGARVP